MIIRGDAAHRQRVRERFLSRAIPDLHGPRPVDDAPCWFFSGKPHAKTGYCQFSVGRQKGLLAHRVAYELWYGEIPAGHEVDHLCHPGDGSCPATTCPHRRCCNPAHLRASTSRANTLRSTAASAANAAKTICDNGHEFTEANTLYTGAHRECRTCNRDKQRRYRAAKGMKVRTNRTHCDSGEHLWNEENVYTAPSGLSSCRPCRNERLRKRRRGIGREAA
jgi:hypothetical protein